MSSYIAMALSIARNELAVSIAGSPRSATTSVWVASLPEGAVPVTREVIELVMVLSSPRAEDSGSAAGGGVINKWIGFMSDGTMMKLRGVFTATTGQSRLCW